MQGEEISLLLWKNTVTTPCSPGEQNKQHRFDRERPLLSAYLTGTKSMGQKGGLIIVGLGTSARGLPWVASRQEQVHRLRRKVCLWYHRRPPRGVLRRARGGGGGVGWGGDHCSYRRTTRDWSLRYPASMKCNHCIVNQGLSLLFHLLLVVFKSPASYHCNVSSSQTGGS